MTKKKFKVEECSRNVSADFGLKDSDELFARAQIGFCVHKIVSEKNLKQREIGGSKAVVVVGNRDHAPIKSSGWPIARSP